MRQKFMFFCIALLITGCSSSSVKPTDFDQFATQLWQAEKELDNRSKTSLPDMSAERLSAAHQQRQQWLNRLEQVDMATLTEQQQINHAILHYILTDAISEYQYGAHLIPLTAESGFHSDLAFIVSGTEFKTPQDYQDYLTKLKTIPAYMQQQTDWMKQGLAKGMTQPKVVLAGFDQGILAFVSKTPEQNVFYRPFSQKPDFVDANSWIAMQAEAKQIVEQQLNPAYQQFYQFMVQQYLPGARDNIAASEWPQGRDYYQNRLEHYTTLKLTPEQVHQTGLDEVARIRAEMQGIINQVGFKGSFADFIQFLRTDPQFYAKTPTDLLKEAAFIAKKVDAESPKYFKTLPRTPFGVVPVPAEIAPKYTTGRYSGTSRDDRAGFYWVNTYALDRRPLYEMEALTLHEAVPGHHLQISLAREQASLPEYRRNFYTSAFGEGWGLYSEYLGIEMGFYQDPYSNFGRLTYEMWRAARLVVDTGMHTMGWSRQKAIDFLASNTALSMHNVTTEIDRYISWPAQALSYKLGELTIKKLRKEAEQQLGNSFDVREFHEVVLRNGSVPLAILEQQVAHYIQQKKQP
ncbi:MAG: DUF885 domain-containing protein [Gammaproteobacteria bacterium]|nr:DUF885 domain-containing protein [Gammaproteobacteria bacterium]MBU2059175.1 DUF885 domain-containing protein [Gammaproteobacteria bacterium]MBU2173726.1 DUF885 domain-containing protein [Gammaproteobacteria bacterium]MBU2246882.1 DUF885 domain-containing protein [Gammaproteobacteria bacterium]MBU2343452.1 DUF885 domain-containing protein [Gammaproteobacteria bacterium]